MEEILTALDMLAQIDDKREEEFEFPDDLRAVADSLGMNEAFLESKCTSTVKRWVTSAYDKGADLAVLIFIGAFAHRGKVSEVEVLENTFTNGYCYYFAMMLKDAFKRGHVCVAGPCAHIVWLDGKSVFKDVAYDVRGINKKYEYLVPIEALKEKIEDFMHVPGLNNYCDEVDVFELQIKWGCVDDIEEAMDRHGIKWR